MKTSRYILNPLIVGLSCLLLVGCEFIRMKKEQAEPENVRKAVARVSNSFLYQDELIGITPPSSSAEDSIARVTAYINSWIRKQLVINEAMDV